MYSRRISLCLFAIAAAQSSTTESTDNSASGFVESPSDLFNSNDPMFNSDTLNLLVYNSENIAVIPEPYKNNPVSSLDRLNGLTYSSENLNDLSNRPMGSETDSNGPSSNSDALNSEILEISRTVVPDLNGPDLFRLDSPVSAPTDKTESDGGLTSNSNHNLGSLRGACISDNRAASQDKENGGSCINPRTEYHKKQGHSGGAHETDDQDREDIEIKAKEDAIWKAKQFYAGRSSQTTEQIRKKCKSIGEYYEIRIIAVCCLGPSHFLALQFEKGHSFYISNEEFCDLNWPERPICLGDDGLIDPNNAFCCEHLGDPIMWGLFWGMNCIRMNALSEAVWN